MSGSEASTSGGEAVSRAVAEYEQAVAQVPTARMYQLFATFLCQLAEAARWDRGVVFMAVGPRSQSLPPPPFLLRCRSEGRAGDLLGHLGRLRALGRAAADAGCASCELLQLWVDCCLQEGDVEAAREVLGVATAKLPGSAELWAQRLSIEARATVGAGAGRLPGLLLDLMRQAVESAEYPAGAVLWPQVLSAAQRDARAFGDLLALVEHRFMAMGPQPAEGCASEAAAAVLHVVQQHRGLEAARAVVDRLMAALSFPGLALLRAAFELDAAEAVPRDRAGGAVDRAAVQRARRALEAAAAAYPSVPSVWLTWVRFERTIGGQDAATLVFRAKKMLQDDSARDEFELAVRALEGPSRA